jgi:hydrogenase nickel incorporation protein HypB
MSDIAVIDLKEKIIGDNEKEADVLRAELTKKGTYYINLMSSPGSGKTSTLLNILKRLPKDLKTAVMEADIDSDVDAVTLEKEGFTAVQLHTGGMCHLSSDMSRQGLQALPDQKFDAVFLENVGNLVCPAEFDTGAHLNMSILSVTEGDDKPLKYPLMFTICPVVIINKIDAISAFNFDMEKAIRNIHSKNSSAVVFPVSARTGEGFDLLTEFLTEKIKDNSFYRDEG